MLFELILFLFAISAAVLLAAYAVWEARGAEYYRQEMYKLRRELGNERMRR